MPVVGPLLDGFKLTLSEGQQNVCGGTRTVNCQLRKLPAGIFVVVTCSGPGDHSALDISPGQHHSSIARQALQSDISPDAVHIPLAPAARVLLPEGYTVADLKGSSRHQMCLSFRLSPGVPRPHLGDRAGSAGHTRAFVAGRAGPHTWATAQALRGTQEHGCERC